MNLHTPASDAFHGIAMDVARSGFAVRPGFVPREEITALRARLEDWWQEGELRHAGIGRGESFQVRDDIRRDYVRWLDFSTQGPFAAFLDAYLEPLRLAINREMFLGVYEFEGHVTVYPPGAFYRRHIDQFRDAAYRRLSLILYLNDDWLPDDGGELRLFLPRANGEDDGEEIVDVAPACGTLVTFLSHEIPHEVLPTKRERFSLTGWFRTRG